MKSLWNDQAAAAYSGDLGLRVYTSRLLGQDKSLVMHGGGNTSVKLTETNILGEPEDLLYVKGSGWDLDSIEAPGFAPVRMRHLLGLAKLETLSDSQMANELKANMTRASAPAPSVEAILHAILPSKFVDHTHADAIISVTNTANGRERVQEIYGASVVVIPYVMPGFKLARLCARIYPAEARPETVGMILMNHGIFTFGATARESYERMIELVTLAENYLTRLGAWTIVVPNIPPLDPAKPLRGDLAALRQALSEVAGFPVIMASHSDSQALGFARRRDVNEISQKGPATPDHVIRTKRVPLLGRDLQGYKKAYEAYFNQYSPQSRQPLTMLDPAPRVILDPEFGLITIGQTAKDAAISEDIYRHTMDIILRAVALGGWQALPAKDIFDVEYWELEQAKLQKAGKPPVFAGEIALVTGAASGIGKACADSMLARGAAVVGLDINPKIETLYKRPDFLGIRCDVTDEGAIATALENASRSFGGLDMLVLNAGIFPSSRRIESLSLAEWQAVMHVNLDANLAMMNAAYPLLKLAPRRGRVAVIGSKNVPAPGPGAAAYSASKAALNQLARVAALEWGADGIRVNIVHPNAVFDTGLWTEELLKTRAEHYKMTVEEYKRNNVLKVPVTSHDVGEMAAEMCGPLFAKTTAAQVPLDGGNERVI
ncbi:MAG TPA: bifunctional aldolase/short-chain dehydrogenase [Aggregatilineales bacterium]|nr:bifunctional aldolase/short-chain dehydrogenase [Aggregatilineales bacterium]